MTRRFSYFVFKISSCTKHALLLLLLLLLLLQLIDLVSIHLSLGAAENRDYGIS